MAKQFKASDPLIEYITASSQAVNVVQREPTTLYPGNRTPIKTSCTPVRRRIQFKKTFHHRAMASFTVSRVTSSQDEGVVHASIPADDRVPDMRKRQLMNLLLLGAISLPSAGMLLPYASFFVPPGDFLYAFLIFVNNGGIIYSICSKLKFKVLATISIACPVIGKNAILAKCEENMSTRRSSTNLFQLLESLALAHADVDDGEVVFVPWFETDFRTGESPWWA
ncbi:cytochrome b6-f complex iron-sulfur subunit 2, chloroplastic-like [Olea europaea var. sylvestris]|uniref:cytochrome b6-f complex iron-sulfur subunit 2, chloroplastic-like n=1 Tax=Olea europaea var. sylvestris TaxID=158386 RepID=UPI000C1CDAF2|nr:cytochrome b6-f complex iron-sulfur subunit 2, chloroplastic-like [Olea europaea var. sylvestris]